MTVQSYLEAIFKETGDRIQKLDKDSIFRLDVAKLFEERVFRVEGLQVVKRVVSNPSIPEESSETKDR